MKNQLNVIPIVVASDTNYLQGLYVTVASALASNRRRSNFHIHVIDLGITTEEKIRFSNFVESFGISFCSFHQIDLDIFRGAKEVRSKGGYSAYARLCMGELLPNISKCIYLDTDVLVLADLQELFATDIPEEFAFSAVIETYLWGHESNSLLIDCPFDIEEEDAKKFSYFNTGVLLCNLDRWRDFGVLKKSLDVIRTHGVKLKCWDQTILNFILRGKIGTLDSKWNTRPLSETLKPAIYHFVAGAPWYKWRSAPSYKAWWILYNSIVKPTWKARNKKEIIFKNTIRKLTALFFSIFFTKSYLKLRRLSRDDREILYKNMLYIRRNILRGGIDTISIKFFNELRSDWRSYRPE